MNNKEISGQTMAAFLRMLNQVNQMVVKPKSFGTNILIHTSEIHTIAAIGDHPGCNISELAEILGIANPSVSEIVQKMGSKELIEKYKLLENRKETKDKVNEHYGFKR